MGWGRREGFSLATNPKSCKKGNCTWKLGRHFSPLVGGDFVERRIKEAREIGCQMKILSPRKITQFPESLWCLRTFFRRVLLVSEAIEVNTRKKLLSGGISNLISDFGDNSWVSEPTHSASSNSLPSFERVVSRHAGKHFSIMKIWWENSSREDIIFHMQTGVVNERGANLEKCLEFHWATGKILIKGQNEILSRSLNQWGMFSLHTPRSARPNQGKSSSE
jgi:hypothetical protein